jgi:hypothetical protein
MDENRPRRSNRVRLTHEALFSLNVGLAVRWAMAQANYSANEIRIKEWVNSYLHLNPHSNVGDNTALFVLSLEIALCIFVVMRIFSLGSWVDRLLLGSSGILSLVALPIAWLYSSRRWWSYPDLPHPPHALLLAELAAAVICATQHQYAKWPLPRWGSIALVTLHFAFWAWIFLGGPLFWREPFYSIFPLAGLCSSLAWGFYVANRNAINRSNLPAPTSP